MSILRRLVIALLTVTLLGTGTLRAAATTDYSDQWWVPNESGWGASVLQQADVLFIDLFVYGADGKPTWYTAAAFYQNNSPTGHQVFAGDLYLTNGSYYGTAWNPAALSYRKVGTLTFDATGVNDATLTYTVDGTPVVKYVTRQLWRFENLAGTYETVWWLTPCGSGGGVFDWAVTRTVIRHDVDNSVTMSVTCPQCWTKFKHDFRGVYSQSGHLGQIVASPDAPDSGSITVSEIAYTTAGFTARVAGTLVINGQTCRIADGYGQLAAVPVTR